MKINKKIISAFFTLTTLFVSFDANANISLPGFKNVGTGRTFLPFYENERKLADKIQMKNEIIKVNLYKGFAVVKGEYEMQNLSDREIKIKVGYPDNGIFISEPVHYVNYNEIDNLKVEIDNKNTDFKVLENKTKNEYYPDKWYVWQTNFPAKKTTKIIVYYMIDTHLAHLQKGYDNEKSSGFAYILESGKLWADKIGKGIVYIKLEEGLVYNDILGITPNKFKYDKTNNSVFYEFFNLEPDEKDNIVLRYQNRTEKFDYQSIKSDYKKYYSDIDKTELSIDKNNLKDADKTDFTVFPYMMSFIVGLLSFVLLIVVLFVYLIVKFIRERRHAK